jgi:hypothetical protein
MGVFNELLLINDREYTCRYTGGRERFMKYAVEMGSGAMIYIYIYIYTNFQKD